MAEITGLVLPFFGMILLGYLAAKITRQPAEALGWLNTFIIYVSLPALFFKLVSKTPIEQLTRVDFILANVSATYLVFALIFAVGLFFRRASVGEATVQGLAAAYGNIGYMGPGLALLAFGEPAAVPVALVFCFENMLHFMVAPALMSFTGGQQRSFFAVAGDVVRRIVTHPFIVATAAGPLRVSAAVDAEPGATVWVALRPEKLRLGREPSGSVEGNCLGGEVAQIAYLGDLSLYQVRLDAGFLIKAALPNVLRLDQAPIGLHERVWLSWPPEAAVLLTR